MLRFVLAILVTLLFQDFSSAFSPLPNVVSTDRGHQSSTAVYFFGGSKKAEKAAPKGKKSSPKKGKGTEEKKKEPFVFLFGKPEYDWVNNKTIKTSESRRINWLYKAPPKK